MSEVTIPETEVATAQPNDPYSPEWMTFYSQNPGFIRSVGSEGVNEGDGGSEGETEAVEETADAEHEAEEVEADDTAEAAETEDDGGEIDGEEETEEPDEEIEFKVGGQTLKVPKGAMPDDVRTEVQNFVNSAEASYTKKFQELSEQKKSVDQAEEAIGKLSGMNDELLGTYTQAQQVKNYLTRLQSEDMNAMWQSDPDRARRHSDQIAQAEREFHRLVNEVAQKETGLTQAQEQEIARRKEAGRQEVERYFKGFNERVGEVVDYAMTTYGLTKEEAEQWDLNPKTAAMAAKAMMYDRMQAKAKPKQNPTAKKAAAPVKPLPGKGGAKAAKKPSEMTPEEYSAWRYKQMAAKSA